MNYIDYTDPTLFTDIGVSNKESDVARAMYGCEFELSMIFFDVRRCYFK